MRIDETTYHHYANWRLENDELLKKLEKDAGNIYYRFKHVIDVIQYYYDKLIDDDQFNEEDDIIFKTGYYYVANQLEDIKTILKKVYNNDITELSKHSKSVNLFLNTIDFQTEVLNNQQDSYTDEDIDRLLDLDQDVYKYIVDKKDVPEEIYDELDYLTIKIFKKLNIDYFSISDIFLEIADELNIL